MNTEDKKNLLQSVQNAIRVLKLFDESKQQLGISEISRALGISKSTAFRLSSTLLDEGMLEQDPDNSKYMLGTELIRIGRVVINRINVVTDAHPFLVELSASVGEAVHLVVLNEDRAMFADKVKGRSFVNMGSSIGATLPAHITASGKVLLAAKSDSDIQGYLSRVKLLPYTARSIVTGPALIEELKAVRREGYATDREESEEGLTCVAVPVFGMSGDVEAAVSISSIPSRMERNFEVYLSSLRDVAMRVSRKLGYSFSDR